MSIAADRSDLITREGYQRLQAELDQLMTTRRAEIARWLRDARDDGSEPGDNADLSDALEEHALLERRIAELEQRLAAARIVAPAADGTVGIGAVVRLRGPSGTTSVYELVGALEADASRRRLSIDSPVGRALLGHVVGDVVEVDVPRGRCSFEILGIEVPLHPAA